jgi:Mn-dependent DtxR family transcriptional regulator
MHLQESGEMYLETIYVLSQSGKPVRSVDVGEYMGFSKPSVSRAVGLLKEGGYVIANAEGHLSLTDEGRDAAEKIFQRHTVLTRLLVGLGVNEETAAEDACRMEHVISDVTYQAIKRYILDRDTE